MTLAASDGPPDSAASKAPSEQGPRRIVFLSPIRFFPGLSSHGLAPATTAAYDTRKRVDDSV